MGCLKLTYDYEKEPTLKCVWNKNRDGGHNSTIDKPDPFTQAPEYTQSYNRYSYAFNNPLLFTDPSGFVAVDDTIGKDGRIYETFTEPDLNGVKPIPSSAIQFANEHQLTRDEINAFRYEWMVKNNASSYHYIRPDGTVEIRFAEKGLEQPAFDPIDGAFIVGSMLKIAISKSAALAAEKILAREVVEEAAKTGSTQLWTSTSKMSSVKNAFWHWKKHGAEFPEFLNAKQYVEGAKNFMHNSPAGTLMKTRANGDILKYHPGTNTFGVMDATGVPRTMFRPTDGMKYWLGQ
jgi:hypothetical protein